MSSTQQQYRYPQQAHPLKHLLDSYTTSHPLRSPSPLPASSRVNPTLTQRLPPASSNPLFWTIPTWIAFVRFVTWKGLHIVWSLLSHFLWGPARKSWGYRMTFIASVMRNVADHTSLADIVLIRRLISLHFLVPLPADAVVTPVTFTVPRHTGENVARGFLADLDSVETGKRELSGEWVVGTEVWQRLKRDSWTRRRRGRVDPPLSTPTSRGDASCTAKVFGRRDERTSTRGIPRGSAGSEGMPPMEYGRDGADSTTQPEKGLSGMEPERQKVIYYIHGGAYYVGNAATHRLITIGVSKACNARVFAITYRLAPEHTFPLPLHDVFHGYLRLLEAPLSIAPENIIIAGDSAGGGLSLALCMYLRDEGYKLPSGLVLMSPWVDLTMSCGSWDECGEWDVVPRPEADDHLNPVGCYLGPKGVAAYVTHPYASPLFGDLRGLPPMLIQSGDSEVLRDENTLLAHKATLAGVHVTHELYEDMVHVFQMFTFLPAARTAINSVGRWVRATLPKIQDGSRIAPREIGEGVEDEMADGARLVDEDGEAVGHAGTGRAEVTQEEITAINDREGRRRTPTRSSLRLDLDSSIDEPSVDLDSLPRSASSGSPTPTGSPVRQNADLFGASPGPRAPRLRRALTAFATSTPATPVHSSPRPSVRQRRRTQGAASLHASPLGSMAALAYSPSNPLSPTPSIRKRLRSPTMSSTHPSTRERSQSHSDIFHLVEGYFEGGAANETTVYAPGGQVQYRGVLGEDE